MPAWGLIPDSPWIYAAQRLGRSAAVSYKPVKSGIGGLSVSFQLYGSRVKIYNSVLNYETHSPGGMVSNHLTKIGRRIVRDARRQVGVRTGKLRNSIELNHIAFREGAAIKIGSRLHYAYLHHEGSKPHVITPNPPNQVLVFGKGSRVVHARVVNHPGTRPNRYLSDQLRKHI